MNSKISLLTVILISLLVFSCKKKESDAGNSIRFVKIEKVGMSRSHQELTFNGKIMENILTSLSVRVGGPLIKLNVNIGDYVEQGEIIAVIDKRDYEIQVKSAKIQYDQLSGEFTRYKELFEKNRIPANSYEKIESGYLMAKTAYESAAHQLNDTELKAPFSGFVHEKFIENHQKVSPFEPIISMIDVSELQVVTSIPENQMEEVKKSKNQYLDIDNADVYGLPISVLSIDEKARPDGLYQMKFTFQNLKGHKILPGMSAEIKMSYKEDSKVSEIPTGAVFNLNNSSNVWVYNNHSKSITRRKVEVRGLSLNGKIEVLSGLRADEYIVTAGVYNLVENQRVKPLQPKSSTNIGRLL